MTEQYAFTSGEPKTRLSDSALARQAEVRTAEWLESARGIGGVRDIRYGLEALRDYWAAGTISADEADRLFRALDILEIGDALLDAAPADILAHAYLAARLMVACWALPRHEYRDRRSIGFAEQAVSLLCQRLVEKEQEAILGKHDWQAR